MLKKISFTVGLLFSLTNLACFSQVVVWSGDVSADGTPTQAIDLKLDKKYQIIAKGTINLGKWVEAGKALGEDASYEYNAPSSPTVADNLRNSINIPLENKNFNPQHIYKSLPFVAKQSKIHFWVHDLDYSDNKGSFTVELVQLD